MNEILNGIKLIKMYAWEGSFAEKLSSIRLKETQQLLIAGQLLVIQSTFAWIGPTIVTFSVLATHGLFATVPLTASQVTCLLFDNFL